MDNYWLTHPVAMQVARRLARITGERHRVEVIRPGEPAPEFMGRRTRFRIVMAVEPCS